MSLCSLLVLLAAASTTNPFFPGTQSIHILLVLLASTLIVLTPRFHSWLHIPHCSRQVWSQTTLAWESLRLGLGRDWTPSVIFRTLSPIWILSVDGYYLFLPLLFGSLYCISCILDSFESSCIYLFCCCCGIFVNRCNDYHQWQPGIGYYVDLGGNAEIYIVPDPWVLQMVSEHGFRFPMLFRYEWLSKQRVRKACRITSLTAVVSRVSRLFY